MRHQAQAKLEEERRAAEARAKKIQDDLNRQLAHAALPQNVIDACRNNQLEGIPALLQQMDNDQVTQLGLNPLAACTSPDSQERVLAMLEAERTRRGIN